MATVCLMMYSPLTRIGLACSVPGNRVAVKWSIFPQLFLVSLVFSLKY
jgi:hypothetical protein